MLYDVFHDYGEHRQAAQEEYQRQGLWPNYHKHESHLPRRLVVSSRRGL